MLLLLPGCVSLIPAFPLVSSVFCFVCLFCFACCCVFLQSSLVQTYCHALLTLNQSYNYIKIRGRERRKNRRVESEWTMAFYCVTHLCYEAASREHIIGVSNCRANSVHHGFCLVPCHALSLAFLLSVSSHSKVNFFTPSITSQHGKRLCAKQ